MISEGEIRTVRSSSFSWSLFNSFSFQLCSVHLIRGLMIPSTPRGFGKLQWQKIKNYVDSLKARALLSGTDGTSAWAPILARSRTVRHGRKHQPGGLIPLGRAGSVTQRQGCA